MKFSPAHALGSLVETLNFIFHFLCVVFTTEDSFCLQSMLGDEYLIPLLIQGKGY